jgi:transcriptional regulator GlxA family with amidase domain
LAFFTPGGNGRNCGVDVLAAIGLVTAAGITSGIDLALWLTERLASPAIARAVATNMEHRRQGAVHRTARATS